MVTRKKVVIDTNIWYHLSGVSINSNVSQIAENNLLTNYEIYLTSASIMEMISKFRNDKENLKKNLKYLNDRNIKIIQLLHFEIDKKIIDKFACLEISEFDSKTIIGTKIKGESNFLRGYVYMIASACFHLLEEKLYDTILDKKSIKVRHIQLTIAIFEGNFESIFENFHELLNQAYIDNNTEQIIKKEFNDLIYLILRIWIINFYILTDEHYNQEDMLDKIYKNKSINETSLDNLQSNSTWRKIKRNKDHIFTTFKGNTNLNKINVFNSEITKGLGFDNHVCDIVIKYITFKIKKILIDGAKFQKNDLIDMMLLSAICENVDDIFTLDQKFLKALKEIRLSSYNLNNSFGFVK
jgi:PIN domain nuclease of toxin-antitoxin system